MSDIVRNNIDLIVLAVYGFLRNRPFIARSRDKVCRLIFRNTQVYLMGRAATVDGKKLTVGRQQGFSKSVGGNYTRRSRIRRVDERSWWGSSGKISGCYPAAAAAAVFHDYYHVTRHMHGDNTFSRLKSRIDWRRVSCQVLAFEPAFKSAVSNSTELPPNWL